MLSNKSKVDTGETDDLQSLIIHFSRTIKSSLWPAVIDRSGVSIDLPSAGILHLLTKCPKSISYLHLLANQLGVEAPFVSRKLQELERAGLVERQTDKADRRAFIVRPTKLGVEAAERLTKTKQTIMTEILGNWQPTDKQELQRLLAQLVKDTEAFEQRTKQMVIQTKE